MGDAVNVMLVAVIELRGSVLSSDRNSGIFSFIHVEFILAVDIAVVLDEVGDLLNLYFEIEGLVE